MLVSRTTRIAAGRTNMSRAATQRAIMRPAGAEFIKGSSVAMQPKSRSRDILSKHQLVPLSTSSKHAALSLSQSRRQFSVVSEYKRFASNEDKQEDSSQLTIALQLDELKTKIETYEPIVEASMNAPKKSAPEPASVPSGGFFSSFFGGGRSTPASKPAPVKIDLSNVSPKGIYLHGEPGTGKSMLMDMFYDEVKVKRKNRVHFHEFMIEAHEKIHRLSNEKIDAEGGAKVGVEKRKEARKKNMPKKGEVGKGTDVMDQVSEELLQKGWLICIDEFQVTHIGDAVILKRLFSLLFEKGAVILATSKRTPEELYLSGLNRHLFLPFIPLLRQKCHIVDMVSEQNYWLFGKETDNLAKSYFFPVKEHSEPVKRKFMKMTKGKVTKNRKIQSKTKTLVVPECGESNDVAYFTFADLCDSPLGAGDYLTLADKFHTIFITDIPALTLLNRNEVRRLITLMDALYERKTKVIMLAEKSPELLFDIGEHDKNDKSIEEIFAWERTISRMNQMQSVDWN